MKICKGHLTLEERQILYVMHGQRKGRCEIARAIGRHASDVKRELERNRPPWYLERELSALERAKYAHDKARQRNSAAKKGRRGPIKLAAVRREIELLLKTGRYSPETIAELIQGDIDERVSGKTIRRWIGGEAPELKKYLPHRGKKPRKRITPKKYPTIFAAPSKCSIHERPEVALLRTRAGDFEVDFLVSKRSTTVIMHIVDRMTRHPWLIKLPNREADTVKAALVRFLSGISPIMRHTLTYDRDSGFAEVHSLEHYFGVANYFCDAYCAWQKGTVERANKDVRKFFPKGTDLSTVSDEELALVERSLRIRPMMVLNKLSPADAWSLQAEKTRHLLH